MTSESPPEPIAIVGIGCNFPGGAVGPNAYWDMLCSGVDATRELPRDRWEIAKFYDPDPSKLGKMTTFRGGFLDRIDQFDAQFFGIAPREAIWLDPQQRLLLQAAWEALEDAGEVVEHLAGSDAGVFMAGFTLDYQLLQNYGVQSRYELQTHSATGMMMTMLANRLSYSFDFHGPSLTVDTACSGSLVAIHLAAQSIWNQECALALVGGVNVMIAPNMTIAESKGGFLSPDGRCKTFDAAANGYARGEGAGVVVLKPLSHALADRNPIYALIRGTGISQDGRTNGITVPNGHAQESAMRIAYRRAHIAPHQVQYVEAHGTGTPIGDPIEAAALGRVMSEGRPAGQQLVIGSVKTNIGHLEAAAGVAGLIKTALALKHRRIPANLHLREPNPEIPFDKLQLRVQTELGNWPADSGGTRYAGVNSFGFGGTNAHVVLQEAPDAAAPTSPRPDADTDRRYVIPLSARSPDALADTALAMRDFLADRQHSLRDVGYSSALRRSQHDHRLTLVAADTTEAIQRLDAFLADSGSRDVATGRAQLTHRPKLAFVCSGMGPQWWAMGRQLLHTEPVFRQAIERCDAELRKYTGWSLLAELLADEGESRMTETEVAQPANFAIQVGLAALWRSLGVEPDAIVGHSTGEVAAQYLAGVLTFEDAIKVNYHRSNLQQRTTGTGRMLAVGMTPATLDQAVSDAGPLVSVAAVNSQSAVTLSGDAAILEDMANQLRVFEVYHRFLNVKVPYHSHYMDPLRADLEASLAELRPRRAAIPLYSTVTGSRIDGSGADASYWWQNVRATVLFAAAVRQMIADGYTHFVELSPHPVLASPITELLDEQEQPGLVVASLRRKEPDDTVLLGSLGALYCHGHEVDWAAFYGHDAEFVRLPSYPWQFKSYWNESVEAREDRHYTQVHALLGQRVNAVHHSWEREVNVEQLAYLTDHRVQHNVLLPGAAFVEMALAAAREVYGVGHYTVENLQLRKALVLGQSADSRLRTILNDEDGSVVIASFLANPAGTREWTVHATAQLSQRTPDRANHDLDGARARCDGRIDRDSFYARSTQMGFHYGPAFQCVEEVDTGTSVAVGRVRIPAEIRADITGYQFHPSLVDAAFQVTLAAATGDPGEAIPYLPVRIDRISVLGTPVADMYAVAEITHADSVDICSDIALCDADGNTLVEISGFRARSLAAAAGLTTEQIDRGLYEVQWQELPPDDSAVDPVDLAEGTAAGIWVLFADQAGVGADLARRLRESERRVILVSHGAVDSISADGPDAYLINPTVAEHFHQLLQRLPEDGQVAGIVHLWSLDSRFGPDDSLAALQDSQDIGVLSVLHSMQALSAAAAQRTRVWLVTHGAQAVGEHRRHIAVEQAPMWGLGRVIGHQEFASRWGGLVDLDAAATTVEQARCLFEEISAAPGEDQIAFRDGKRYVARLVESDNLTPAFPVQLRSDGSYLVTGGLGALGLLVARYLVEHGACHIVLMARTPVPSRDRWRAIGSDDPQRALIDELLALEASGADIQLAAVDVADEQQLSNWLAEHRRLAHPPVRGVVHTAGVVEDELLVRMSATALQRVLRPKLLGGWLLHRLLRDQPLDFFAMFGSTGSVIASPGQGNYAAANAFLDALAHHRRSVGLPAITIGWGPWSVGMVDKLNLAQMYAQRGIQLISPQAGMRILGRVLAQRPAHLVAITVDWAMAREASATAALPPLFAQLGTQASDIPADLGDGEPIRAALGQASDAQRPSVMAAYLHEVAALVLGLAAADFGDEDALTSLGMDSMMAIQMKRRVDAALGVDLPVLDLLEGATIAGLAARTLSVVDFADTDEPPEDTAQAPADSGPDPVDELAELLAQTPAAELARVLSELEAELPDRSPTR
ncbi:type I polyketide synthase [Nocardia sp. NPDC051321]|uniref:type I polyketide synthase n=1 Tax=Nocardia sp. NPDC051321 TaxID=3364323 RepID=UPI0037ACF250